MTAYDHFIAKQNELYDILRAAEHSVSFAAHIMDVDGTDSAIVDYEKALDYAALVRRQIGENSDAHMAARAKAAGLEIKETDPARDNGVASFSISAAYRKHEEAALYGKWAA